LVVVPLGPVVVMANTDPEDVRPMEAKAVAELPAEVM
jgi:hypothetical protein